MVDVKICGLTRSEDARLASQLGAKFVGVIFAGGPRRLAPSRAAAVLAGVPAGVRKVGVVAEADPASVALIMNAVPLDVIQVHGDAAAVEIRRLREAVDATVWAVVRVRNRLPAELGDIASAADAVLLDTRSEHAAGGTGQRFDWDAIARELEPVRGDTPVVLAGGLTPDNVGEAIRVLRPDIVDVASGVEASVGAKDPDRMRRFIAAVRDARLGA